MKNLMIKVFKITILMIFLVVIGIAIKFIMPVVESGYDMYRNAVNKTDISVKINEIKAKENYITIDEIPNEFKEQLIKSEDRRFYYHFGFDPIATTRAMCNNIILGRFAQGGSTISQQLAKNMYFSFEKTLDRKVAELLTSYSIEAKLTKDEILELYCNICYFGEGCYGIKEATEHYYKCSPNELSNDEIAALVFTIKCPNVYNPNVYVKQN